MERTTRMRRSALLVEDHAALRTSLEELLRSRGFEVSSAANAREALVVFPEVDPDVLVADIDLGERPDGIELATILRAQAPYLGVVFLSDFPSLESVERLHPPPAGAAFLTKSLLTSADDLVAAIDTALDDSAEPLVKEVRDSENPIHRLSPTQLATARYLAMGMTNAEIAKQRGSSVRAVEQIVTRMFESMGLANDPSRNPRVVAATLYIRAFGQPPQAS